MQIDDYVEKVEKVMDKVANLGFVATNKVGARIFRNKAEMEVRYQDMLSDLEALKEDKFVIVSQHKDASLRCACWQGLIYLKDTDGTDINLETLRVEQYQKSHNSKTYRNSSKWATLLLVKRCNGTWLIFLQLQTSFYQV